MICVQPTTSPPILLALRSNSMGTNAVLPPLQGYKDETIHPPLSLSLALPQLVRSHFAVGVDFDKRLFTYITLGNVAKAIDRPPVFLYIRKVCEKMLEVA